MKEETDPDDIVPITDTERIDWLERIASEGASPGLINDDNGHWAVSFNGMQGCIDHGDEPVDVNTMYLVAAKDWKNSIREAIDAAILDGGFNELKS